MTLQLDIGSDFLFNKSQVNCSLLLVELQYLDDNFLETPFSNRI